MPLQTSQILNNRYRIVKLLATGGYGTVYRAWDLQLNCACAVKENLDQTSDAQRQFAREADLLTQLSHPNLPRVIEHFTIPGLGQFLVMEFIEGEDLEAMRARNGGALAEGVVLQWMSQVFEALTYLHHQNPPVIHRDIKPANICITPQGRAVLVDFGIAKQTSGRTTKGAKGVTPGFSPPEQYTGSGTDERSDIYALGATLYTLLTGIELPESIHRFMGQSSTQPPHLLVPGVSSKVSMAIMRAINPDKLQRYSTIADFNKDLFGKTGFGFPRAFVPAASAFVVVALLAVMFFGGFPPFSPQPAVTKTVILPGNSTRAVVTPQTPTQTTVPHNPTQPPPPPDIPQPVATPTNPPQLPPPPTATATQAVYAPPGMAYIPEGTFSMGASEAEMEWHLRSCNSYARCHIDDYRDMMPRHNVQLSPYYIDINEVTNGEYRQCQKDGKCAKPNQELIAKYLEQDYATNLKYDDFPVVAISWTDAQNYCQWAGGKQLPSEAQWERAAKGDDDRFYPWVRRPEGLSAQSVFGGSIPRANFCDNGCPMENWDETRLNDGWIGPAPVGSFGPGPFGLNDMAGNVTEWILDVYSDEFYANSPLRDPVFQGSGPWRITRGGGWNNGIYGMSSVFRSAQEPNTPKAFIGFRCVQEIP